jgi:hypothetical protein
LEKKLVSDKQSLRAAAGPMMLGLFTRQVGNHHESDCMDRASFTAWLRAISLPPVWNIVQAEGNWFHGHGKSHRRLP